MSDKVIRVKDLVKNYGNLTAVDGISFDVNRGEIFGIVGPNGAGKTTTVECVEGIREFSSGQVEVLGMHPQKDAARLKHHIGIQLQESQLPDRIKAKEALNLFGALYKRSIPWESLVEQLGLEGKMNSYYDNLSGGQKQRLSIAMALINDPQIVFFDELTTGLDPQARRTIWSLVDEVRDMGKTVILVTHFMEEAERLCERVAIIDNGKVIAIDSPKNLIKENQPSYHVSFRAEENGISQLIAQHEHIRQVSEHDGNIRLEVAHIIAVADLIHLLASSEIDFHDFSIQQPNLEDVFISLTGKTIRN